MLSPLRWTAIGLVAALCAALAFFFHLAESRGADLKVADQRADAATTLANAWQENAKMADALASDTIRSRADERANIAAILTSAGAAKGEIANAPGASDAFRYSDPAYRFMRAQASGPASTPPTPAAKLGGE